MYEIKRGIVKKLKKDLEASGAYVEDRFREENSEVFDSYDMAFFDKCYDDANIKKCRDIINERNEGVSPLQALQNSGMTKCLPKLIDNSFIVYGMRKYLTCLNRQIVFTETFDGKYPVSATCTPMQVGLNSIKGAFPDGDLAVKSGEFVVALYATIALFKEYKQASYLLSSAEGRLEFDKFLLSVANSTGIISSEVDVNALFNCMIIEKSKICFNMSKYGGYTATVGGDAVYAVLSYSADAVSALTYNGNEYTRITITVPDWLTIHKAAFRSEQLIQLYTAIAEFSLEFSKFSVSDESVEPISGAVKELRYTQGNISHQIYSYGDLLDFMKTIFTVPCKAQVEGNNSTALKLLEDAGKKVSNEDAKNYLVRAEKKMDDTKSDTDKIKELFENMKILVQLVKDVMSGEYKKVPYVCIATVIGAIVYFVSPVDALPDVLPALGFVDDAAVIALVLAAFKDYIDDYVAWKNSVTSDIPGDGLKWCRENAPEAMQSLSDSLLWSYMKSSYEKFQNS